MSQTESKIQGGVQFINQQLKEQDVQKKAKELNLSYVNLINAPINPDFANFLNKEDSLSSNSVVFFKSGKRIRIAMLDPMKTESQALIVRLRSEGYDVNINLCSEESLKNAQKIYFSQQYERSHQKTENVIEENDLSSVAEEIKNLELLKDQIESSSFDKGLNYIQVGAYKTHASDIHFQPEENNVLVRFRVDGLLKPVFYLSKKIYEGLLKEIKYLSHLKLNITHIPQDGQYNFLINQRKINVRVSVLPSHYGETCVVRLLDPHKAFQSFEKLGFEGVALQHIRESVQLTHGMVLVTGPTGSGKTTTLYSMLQSIDVKSKKIITLEDPIEYHLTGIIQSQVNPEGDYTFSSGLRAILRQDPDVIMVGEVRDRETAETAAQASLTGHLVFTTLHTNSAIEALYRLSNMGVKSFILAPALDLVIAQRLVRKLCLTCAQSRPTSDSEKAQIAQLLESMTAKGIQISGIPEQLKESPGCDTCDQTGFVGQIAIAEVLRFDSGLRDLVLENKPMAEVYRYADENSKMLTLKEDGVLKVLEGLTTLAEVYRVAA